jgi:hypothetical protein
LACLHRSGGEIDPSSGQTPDAFSSSGVTSDATIFRSGTKSAKFDSTAGNAAPFLSLPKQTGTMLLDAVSASGTSFIRVYKRYTNLPTAASARVLDIGNRGAFGVYANLTSGGKLQLFNAVTGTQIGSDSAATITTGTFYRIEMKVTLNAITQVTDVELRLDGVTVASATGQTIAGGTTVSVGWASAPGANCVCHGDDFAVNDSTGAVNNTWVGDSKIVYLRPDSDSAVGTGWINSGGTGVNLFNSVDNTPPTGIADTTANDTHQVRNATSNANSSYDAALTSYAAAGISAGDIINAVIPFCVTGAPVTTGAKQGTFGISSNPTIANVALSASGTAGAFWAGSAAGAYPVGWKWTVCTITENPTVTLGTSPVARITQVTSSTRIAMCCAMGMYVEYTPSAPKSLAAKSRNSYAGHSALV